MMTWRDYVRWCAVGLVMWFLAFVCYVIGYAVIRAVFG